MRLAREIMRGGCSELLLHERSGHISSPSNARRMSCPPVIADEFSAFSGKVDTGFPQKMRPPMESRARSQFNLIGTRSSAAGLRRQLLRSGSACPEWLFYCRARTIREALSREEIDAYQAHGSSGRLCRQQRAR